MLKGFQTLEQNQLAKILLQKLDLIHKGLEINSNKMKSSTKFIDYFVHDMLDYTILTNKSQNFIKDIAQFDLEECIQEIHEILEDKLKMKNIKLEVDLKGFGLNTQVMTDQKRF